MGCNSSPSNPQQQDDDLAITLRRGAADLLQLNGEAETILREGALVTKSTLRFRLLLRSGIMSS